ncbi:DUF370 domain-containing protein [Candidatus Acetothermia bacterium]|nr:DUF370 domain-containing protein [Candidatus Acetothermia bacterium]MBI3460381.1 DUF370 domain-containing protein [Candidatus Acetothermia bacterium]
MSNLVKLGAKESIASDEIILIAKPSLTAVRQLAREYVRAKRCINGTGDRRANSAILTTDDTLILSSLRIRTVVDRVLQMEAE